jgi:hypothetical protein
MTGKAFTQLSGKAHKMTNFNDAKITSLYVSERGAIKDIEDNAPNSPGGGKFRVTLEMVAGGAVAGQYHLHTTCSDLTETQHAVTLDPPVGSPLNPAPGTASFEHPPWKHDGMHWVFNESVTIDPPNHKGHVYRYTAALHSDNGQVVSMRESEPFILL